MKATVTQYERVWKYKNYYDEGHTGDPFDSYNSWIVFAIRGWVAYAMYTLHSEACLCLNQRGHLAKRVKSDMENMLGCCEDILPKNCHVFLTYINLWQVFFYPENNSLMYSILGWSLQRCSYQRFCLRNVNNSTRMDNEIRSWHFNV